jgi:hypothetical protein
MSERRGRGGGSRARMVWDLGARRPAKVGGPYAPLTYVWALCYG